MTTADLPECKCRTTHPTAPMGLISNEPKRLNRPAILTRRRAPSPPERGIVPPSNGESLKWAQNSLGIPTDSEVWIGPLGADPHQGSAAPHQGTPTPPERRSELRRCLHWVGRPDGQSAGSFCLRLAECVAVVGGRSATMLAAAVVVAGPSANDEGFCLSHRLFYECLNPVLQSPVVSSSYSLSLAANVGRQLDHD